MESEVASKNLEKWFLIIALTVGSLLIFLTPPMASPDENDHFFNAIAFSEGNWLPEIQDDMRGRVLPTCVVDFVNSYNERFAGNVDEKYSYHEAYLSWELKSDFEPHSFQEYWNSNVSLLAYLPSGIGIFIYRILGKAFSFIVLSPYNLLMVGRLCNLLFYVFLIYFAIKWSPIMKKTMFLVALLPMSIFLASTLSYDTVIIGCSMLLFARSMKILSTEETVCLRDLIVICFCSLMCFSVKQAYIPLLIVLLAIPIHRFGDYKRYICYVSITMLSGLIPYFLFTVGKAIVEKEFVWKYADAMEVQKNVILGAPLHFIQNIGNSFMHLGRFYYISMLGCLGQLDTNLPIVLIYGLTIIILLISIMEASSQNIITMKSRIMTLVGVWLTVYAMFAGMYLIWTGTRFETGLNYVEGIQGRYFIPLYCWITILFANSKLMKRYKWIDKCTPFVIGICIYSLCITLICVCLRYWI